MKPVWIIVILFVSTIEIQAQYRTYKRQYDVKDYKYQQTDPYNPTGACLLSIVPGLGHLYVGEPVKALMFSVMIEASLIACVFGVSKAYQRGDQNLSTALIFGGAAGFVGTYIWSWADVTRVAKIKNLAFRDKNLSFHFYPSIQPVTIENSRAYSLTGATLAIRF